jgi:hypothetical protein
MRHAPDRVYDSHFLPLRELVRLSQFHLVFPNSGDFNLMACQTATLPPGFLAKGSRPRQVSRLTYGFKGGGVVRAYELSATGIRDPYALAVKLHDAGIFKDVARTAEWLCRPSFVGKTLILPTSLSAPAETAFLKALGHPMKPKAASSNHRD